MKYNYTLELEDAEDLHWWIDAIEIVEQVTETKGGDETAIKLRELIAHLGFEDSQEAE